MSIRYQDDFDNAINAEWKAEHPIPAKYPRYTNFTTLSEKQEQIMIDICKSGSSPLVTQIFNLYKNQNDEQVLSAIHEQTQQILECESKETLVHLILSWIPLGRYYLMHVCHSGTSRNPKFQIPHINFGGLSLPDKTYYTERLELKAPFLNMIATLFGKCVDLPEDVIEKSGVVWSIESRIAQDHYSRAEKRTPLKTYHPTTLRALVKRMGVSMFGCLTSILPDEYHDITVNSHILPDTFVDVIRMCELVDLKAWFVWKVIRNYVGTSLGEMYDAYFDFYSRQLNGIEVPRPIEERAALFTKSYLEDEFNRVYMSDYCDPNLPVEFPKFVEKLRAALGEKMSRLPWMTEATKAKALEKLRTMKLKVVGPDPSTYDDYSVFDKEYSSLYDFKNDYYKWDWEVLEVREKMYQLRNLDTWEMCAMDVNAYYHPLYNEIAFPAGILQAPFYDSSYSYGENAGGIGAVICHEMTHGFDDQGSQYDKDGYLHCWWSQEDRDNYNAVISSMEEYFNSLTYLGEKVNGRLTQGENLADLGGMKIALYSCADDEERVECMRAWGKTWRANVRDAYAKQMMTVDPHSLPRYRINGILPHIPDFYRLFDVKEGDGMYVPEERRCTLWDD